MFKEFILYVLVLMILYDLSVHIFELLEAFGKTRKRHPLTPAILFDYLSKGNQLKRTRIYQTFWVSYWGFALLLILIYLLN